MQSTPLSPAPASLVFDSAAKPPLASWLERVRGLVRARGRTFLKVLLLSTGLWLVVGIVSFLHALWLGVGESGAAFRLTLFEWGPWLIVSPFVVVLAAVAPITRQNWKRRLLLHLAVSLGVAVAINALTLSVARRTPPPGLVREGPDGPRPSLAAPARGGFGGPRPAGALPARTAPSLSPLLNARLTLPIYWLLVAAVHAWRHHRLALEREGRAVRAEREAVRARLAALQAQLQPHFLFNSLNAITALINPRPAAAENMVCALSNLLRRILHTAERAEIPLSQELDFARDYLAIHRIRFEDTLKIRWDCDPAANTALVPPLILQPLIENAIEHGLRGAPGEVAILTRVENARLVLIVTDEAARLKAGSYTPPPSPRVGLRNTRERLETLFGANYRLDLELLSHGARAEIHLPFRTETLS